MNAKLIHSLTHLFSQYIFTDSVSGTKHIKAKYRDSLRRLVKRQGKENPNNRGCHNKGKHKSLQGHKRGHFIHLAFTNPPLYIRL